MAPRNTPHKAIMIIEATCYHKGDQSYPQIMKHTPRPRRLESLMMVPVFLLQAEDVRLKYGNMAFGELLSPEEADWGQEKLSICCCCCPSVKRELLLDFRRKVFLWSSSIDSVLANLEFLQSSSAAADLSCFRNPDPYFCFASGSELAREAKQLLLVSEPTNPSKPT